jgi:putative transcriptional regulator
MPHAITNDLKGLRGARGVTQEALAAAVGVSRQTIIAIEKGNYVPSLLLAMNIARVFKARVEDIFTFKR